MRVAQPIVLDQQSRLQLERQARGRSVAVRVMGNATKKSGTRNRCRGGVPGESSAIRTEPLHFRVLSGLAVNRPEPRFFV
jgi:hypothetical protein